MSWEHPTGNTPNCVHIVCAGYTQRDFLCAVGVYNTPVPTDVEIWSLNKALRGIKADFGFVMDDLIGENTIDAKYIADLGKIGIPMLTSNFDYPVAELVKDHQTEWHAFPIHELRDRLGQVFGTNYVGEVDDDQARKFGNDLLYLKNSMPIMLAYAWFIGVKTVFLWGADYTHPFGGSRREDDQPNAEYWVGFLRGQGVQVVLSADTTLCKTREGKSLYGYGARQPRL